MIGTSGLKGDEFSHTSLKGLNAGVGSLDGVALFGELDGLVGVQVAGLGLGCGEDGVKLGGLGSASLVCCGELRAQRVDNRHGGSP